MNIQKTLRLSTVAMLVGGALAALSGATQNQPTHDARASAVAVSSEVILAGGCFWCMEAPFEKLNGVLDVVAGYSGGNEVNPTYQQVSSGKTGHREVVLVKFDAGKISLEQILEVFWRSFDPTDSGGQFADRGFQYSSAVYVKTDVDRRIAEASRQKLIDSKKFSKPIVTPIESAQKFYPAEEYHQDYYKKNPIRYQYYRRGSGRDQFLSSVWGEQKK
jgi:peptide methionine sulfoxide reductase msrA/msrB